MIQFRTLGSAAVNLFMAGVLAWSAFTRFQNSLPASGPQDFSEIILGGQFLAMAFFFLVRRRATAVSWHVRDLTVTTVTLFVPLFFVRAAAGRSGMSGAGVFLQIAGSAVALLGMVSLNRSIGVLPANRGLRTGGMYGIVRHPVYAGYQLSYAGYLLANLSFYNAAVTLACFLTQLLRIYAEERVLARDPAYCRYREKVRWRLFPFIV